MIVKGGDVRLNSSKAWAEKGSERGESGK